MSSNFPASGMERSVQSKSVAEVGSKSQNSLNNQSQANPISLHANRVQRQNMTKEVETLKYRMSLLQQEEDKIGKQTQKI